MSFSHYTDHDNLEAAITGFCELCRLNQLPIGLNHSQEALKTAQSGFLNDLSSLKYALAALFCTCPEERPEFYRLFDIYWRKKAHEYSPTTTQKNRSNLKKKSKGSIVMVGQGEQTSTKEEGHNVSGANKIEALRKTDFSKVADIDHDLLDELANRLLKQLNFRLKRRLRSSKKGAIDLRQTIRKNLSSGDNFLELFRKNRKFEKYRLVLLLDVSGSMDKYSFYLLKFIWALKSHFKEIEAFIFSTKLVRITDFIDQSQIETAMNQMSAHADNWSSGTVIGSCFKTFNDQFAKRILNGRSITVILSDGLDTGEPELLGEELQKIRLRTKKVVWLNPLKGMEGYEPLARGMAAALPEIHTFETAHNLDSLLELEKYLSHVS